MLTLLRERALWNIQTTLPFCSQKEKRDENAILAGLMSWAVLDGDEEEEEVRKNRGSTARGKGGQTNKYTKMRFSTQQHQNSCLLGYMVSMEAQWLVTVR